MYVKPTDSHNISCSSYIATENDKIIQASEEAHTSQNHVRNPISIQINNISCNDEIINLRTGLQICYLATRFTLHEF